MSPAGIKALVKLHRGAALVQQAVDQGLPVVRMEQHFHVLADQFFTPVFRHAQQAIVDILDLAVLADDDQAIAHRVQHGVQKGVLCFSGSFLLNQVPVQPRIVESHRGLAAEQGNRRPGGASQRIAGAHIPQHQETHHLPPHGQGNQADRGDPQRPDPLE